MFPIPSVKAQMNPQTTFVGERWRIGFLTEALVRLEWSDSGVFEDEATRGRPQPLFRAGTPKFPTLSEAECTCGRPLPSAWFLTVRALAKKD